jgi:hypothetical protein
MGIDETKWSILDKIQRINNNQRILSEKIQGNYETPYKMETKTKQDLLCICNLMELTSKKTRGEQASIDIEAVET